MAQDTELSEEELGKVAGGTSCVTWFVSLLTVGTVVVSGAGIYTAVRDS